jgi:O-antigen ligase
MANQVKTTKASGILKFLLIGSALVTLSFWTTFADPFNPLKLMLILILAFWVLGHLVIDRNQLIKKRDLRTFLILITIFIVSLLVATVNSDVKQVAWVGDYQRNNGFLFYFGLSIILVAVAFYFRITDLQLFSNLVIALSLLISTYGLFQINGVDFVKWNNPYNAIISTVGNPNFAGAILAALGVLLLGFGLSKLRQKKLYIFNLSVFLLVLFTIYLSEARQGLIGLAVGCSFVVGVWVYVKSRMIGMLLFVALGGLGVFAILGMLQVGPLSQLLYKGSVTIRGYYWRAGLKMFMDHPWLGVGFDYYGGYFKQYREVGYPLNYGYEITSTNAHNVFIQIFSTAGVFAGTAYLSLTLYIFWRGIHGIRNAQQNKKIEIATIFGAWLTLQSISVISIDSPGVAIWSWVLAGMIFALTSSSNTSNNLIQKDKSSNLMVNQDSKKTLLSSFLIIPVLVLSIGIFRVESSVFLARQIYNPKVEANGKYLQNYVLNLAKSPLINSTQVTELASFIATSGFASDGIELLNNVISKEPRNQDAMNLLANYYSELKQPDLALKLRLKIIELDPYNAKNYYQAGLIYKTFGDFTNMEKMRNKILGFARNTPEGAAAVKDLVP